MTHQEFKELLKENNPALSKLSGIGKSDTIVLDAKDFIGILRELHQLSFEGGMLFERGESSLNQDESFVESMHQMLNLNNQELNEFLTHKIK